jgi:hypothetical protein
LHLIKTDAGEGGENGHRLQLGLTDDVMANRGTIWGLIEGQLNGGYIDRVVDLKTNSFLFTQDCNNYHPIK